MGLSSSQARLLNLTSRMHQIEYKAAKIEAEKLQMANKSKQVYQEYQNALEQTKIQMKYLASDASIEWKDISCYDLMYGNGNNPNNPGFPQHSGFYHPLFAGASSGDTGTGFNEKNALYLCSPENGYMFVPEGVKDAYYASNNAADFASRLSNYTPPAKPKDQEGENNPVNPSVNPPVNPPDDQPDDNPVKPPDDQPDDHPVNPPDDNPVNPPDDNPVNPPDDNPVNPENGDGTGPINPEQINNNLKLSRGQNKTYTFNSTEQILTLTNPFTGSNYQYRISTNNNSNQSVSLKFLNNGRLVIQGNNLNITALDNQKDDIILLGSNNVVNTGDCDDIIRVGVVIDSSDPSTNKELYKTQMNYALYNGNINVSGGSDNNEIYAGNGNDHILMYATNTKIDGQNGEDSIYYYTEKVSGTKYNNSESIFNNSANNIENIVKRSTTIISGVGSDNTIDAHGQGEFGSCRFLALLNSLGDDFKNYVQITEQGDNWKVNLLKSGKSILVSKDEVINKGYSYGDPDIVIAEYAINKLINNGYNLETDSFQDYSNLLFGTKNTSFYVNKNIYNDSILTVLGEKIVILGNAPFSHDGTDEDLHNKLLAYGTIASADNSKTLSKSLMQILWSKKQAGTISNLVVGADYHNKQLQIVGEHAYTVSDVKDNYIELINPWDNQDRLRLDWSTFMQNFSAAYVFGDKSNDNSTNLLQGKDLYNVVGSGNIDGIKSTHYGAGSGNPTYDYYYQLFDAISESGGCISIPDDMLHSTRYLANMLNNGAYLKMYNLKTGEWEGTSVATNTSLREVDDEKELRKAEAKYEADMRRIDYKDRKFDYDLAALDAERNAVKQEMETLKTVAKDNVDRTFKLFS